MTGHGLHCPAGDFHIDPWKPVDFAVITHAHSDHARSGSRHYLAATPGKAILHERIGAQAKIEAVPYGHRVTRNGVAVSLHPAGHILGSAQVRVEHRGEVWVVSGDYKTEAEPSCAPFEPVRCNVFITESTFGLPIYRWRPQTEIFGEINAWWRACREAERTAVLFCYSLGKAQRILAGVNAEIGPIVAHYSVEKFLPLYAEQRVKLPAVTSGNDAEAMHAAKGRGLVIAPMSTDESAWLSRMGPVSRAFASGWMQVRGARRRQALDRGFTLSDHADWPGLLASIRATGAERVLVTHGYTTQLARWLEENGWRSGVLKTQFGATDPTQGKES